MLPEPTRPAVRPPADTIAVSAHRNLRGPFTAAGSVVRAVAPAVLADDRDLAQRHDLELLAVAPELRATLPCHRENLTSGATPQARTRFYPRARATRVAHGVTEFLLAAAERGYLRRIVVWDADQADPTDTEWLSILQRRADPEVLAVSSAGPAPVQALPDDASAVRLGELYVAGDCTAAAPRLRAGYEALDDATRAALHDQRAAELAARVAAGEVSLAFGALPLHRELGTDPRGAGAEALLAAIEHCVLEGWYEAVIALGERCFGVLDWQTRPQDCWLVTAKVTTALTALDRPEEAEALYDTACASTLDPGTHLQSAYGKAMLFTRFHTGSRRDHHKAKALVNTAIAMSHLLPDEQRRAFNTTFNENGLALVEMHLGNLDEALRLVESGIARLDAEVSRDQHTQHRSVLAYNRAQLLAAMGPVEAALEAYREVIAEDPNFSEYYLERASLWRRIGRTAEAMADYAEAIRLSPPYPEPHYNRADLALSLGDLDLALAEFGYVLELDPEFIDARVNRAGLLLDLGLLEEAAEDVRLGLAQQPEHALLRCLAGQLAAEQGDPDGAQRAFDAALAADPDLVPALAGRAAVSYDRGAPADLQAAVADLVRAVALDDDPDLRDNLALAQKALAEAAA